MLSSDFHCKENDGTTGAAQKQLLVEVSQDMLDSTNCDPDFMNTIITGDESWVYEYDPETRSIRHENPTRALNTTSLKCWLPSTDAIDRWKKFRHAY